MLLSTLFKHWSYRFFAPGMMLRQSYDAFKELLEQDGRSHDLMAELELLYHDGKRLDFAGVNKLFNDFSLAVAAMVDNLVLLHPSDAALLGQYYKKFDFYTRFLLAPPEQPSEQPYALELSSITDSTLSGNKAFNLAKLKNELQAPVPEGFVITTNAFHRLLVYNNLREPLDALLATIDIEDTVALQESSKQLMTLVTSAAIPPEVSEAVHHAYAHMELQNGVSVVTAARSSAVSEDGEYSFAGQYHTELGVQRETVLESYLKVLASKYSPEALFYRITLGFSDEETSMGVLILSMVDAATSGVVYTGIPEHSERQEMAVHTIYGLGEVLVGGKAVGDSAYLDCSRGEVVRKEKGTQATKLVLAGVDLKEHALEQVEKEYFCLGDNHLLQLGKWADQIERLNDTPQDIEWAVAGDGSLFILQSRPLQQEKKVSLPQKSPTCKNTGQPLLTGGQKAAGGVAAGPIFIGNKDSLQQIEQGAVLVTGSTPPSLVRILNKVVAVVAEQGSTAGHFSTVCREFGIPLLIGVPNALETLRLNQVITVDADNQIIYAGAEDTQIQNQRKKVDHDLQYFRKLGAIMGFITPLNLVDPDSPDFRPDSCRSMHDIIRYTHELAVRTMFSQGEKTSSRSKKRLQTELPLVVNLLDVGGGLCSGTKNMASVALENICCRPFLALWRGLSHPGVDWQSHSHFDWKTFDEVALAGGLVNKNSADLASYAIVSQDYLNLNMRFGYHFTLVDALCGTDPRTNYCQLRFAGGGGDYTGRSMRLEFLDVVLGRLGLEVTVKADLLDARLTGIDAEELCTVLDMIGRLLGATKLLDMVLKQKQDVDKCVQLFFNEQYAFTEAM